MACGSFNKANRRRLAKTGHGALLPSDEAPEEDGEGEGVPRLLRTSAKVGQGTWKRTVVGGSGEERAMLGVSDRSIAPRILQDTQSRSPP